MLKKYNVDDKNVLVIAYIFPPVGGSGVQRTLKYVKYLLDFGWKPTVVTVGKTKFPYIDETLMNEIPKCVEIIRVDDNATIDNTILRELIGLYAGIINDKELINTYISTLKNNNSLADSLRIPDQYCTWALSVLHYVNESIDFSNYDLIYSSSGPYSNHIIGYYVKRFYHIPWIADFRDEWTNNPYFKYDVSSIKYKMDSIIENRFLEFADKIVTISSIAVQNYITKFNVPETKIVEITNGYDEDDFKEVCSTPIKNAKFTIVYNGTLYSVIKPVTFLMAINNLIKKKLVSKDEILVNFTATENEQDWINYVNEYGLEENIKILGYLNHKKSLDLASKADMLLLIIGSGSEKKSVYTSKLFEYLRLGKPILSLAPKDGLADKIINETGHGYNVEFNDVSQIEKYVLDLYMDWKNDKQSFRYNYKKISKYERKNLTSNLVKLFNEVVSKSKFPQGTNVS